MFQALLCTDLLLAAGRPSRAELQNEIKSVLTLKDLKTLIFFDTRD